MTAGEWKKTFDSRQFHETYTYMGNDLGAVYSREQTTFKVWAPTASDVSLHLYTTGSDEEGGRLLLCTQMKPEDQGIFQATVEGDLHGVYYTYTITVDGQTEETGDIYARAAGVNGRRSMVVDLARTNPLEWESDSHVFHCLGKSMIWEVHIGDFSHDPASGVSKAHRGKYAAFTEDTTLNNDGIHPTCVAYLKELGVTHIHLLPAFDYGSVDERTCDTYNWGYDPLNYNVPEGSYATDPFHGEVRIREFKQMVAALHRANISVIMDVVYNHTSFRKSYFNYTVPYYYYRLNPDGTYADGSACGNDTASERPMFRKYMIDSVLYWAREYHIDGFRFDLMGLHDTDTMNAIRNALDGLEGGSQIFIYGEPWTAAESPLPKGSYPSVKENIDRLAKGIAVFNDDTRDAIKGPYNKLDIPGFVNGKPDLEENIRRAVLGLFDKGEKTQPLSPAQVLNYASAHDNSTLWDKLTDSVKKDGDYETMHEDLLSMNRLAAAIVQLSAGIPFLQAGEEAGRTKQGEDNSYNLSKQLNQLDWQRMYRFESLMRYYRGLHEVRNRFSGFYDLSPEVRKRPVFRTDVPPGVVAYTIDGIGGTDVFQKVTVVWNANRKKIPFRLDPGEHQQVVSECQADSRGIRKVSGTIEIEAISAAVFVM